MRCEEVEVLLVESLMSDLEPSVRRAVAEHLASCAKCAAEAAEMETTWRDLGAVDRLRKGPDSERMVQRFRRELQELERKEAHGTRPDFTRWWAGLWAVRPAWQLGFSSLVLVCGVLLGLGISAGRSTPGEIRELQSELQSMNRAVTVLLQDESASERLRAVNRSTTGEPSDIVLDALLQSARVDPNVNVRLAAVDALANYADRGAIRSQLIDSLAAERSPLVQLAVLEVVAGEHGFRAEELERILKTSHLDPTVLRHFSVMEKT